MLLLRRKLLVVVVVVLLLLHALESLHLHSERVDTDCKRRAGTCVRCGISTRVATPCSWLIGSAGASTSMRHRKSCCNVASHARATANSRQCTIYMWKRTRAHDSSKCAHRACVGARLAPWRRCWHVRSGLTRHVAAMPAKHYTGAIRPSPMRGTFHHRRTKDLQHRVRSKRKGACRPLLALHAPSGNAYIRHASIRQAHLLRLRHVGSNRPYAQNTSTGNRSGHGRRVQGRTRRTVSLFGEVMICRRASVSCLLLLLGTRREGPLLQKGRTWCIFGCGRCLCVRRRISSRFLHAWVPAWLFRGSPADHL